MTFQSSLTYLKITTPKLKSQACDKELTSLQVWRKISSEIKVRLKNVLRERGVIPMIIGAPREIKNHEYRIDLTPEEIQILSKDKHFVSVESGAGVASGFSDDDFKKAGTLITNQKFVWLSDIIVKVKEPLKEEYELMKPCQIIFAFFHLPANPELKKIILEKKIRVLPYENIQLSDGSRPVLKAMSRIAAEISVDAAAHYLRKENGGKGILLRDAIALIIGCEGTLGKKAFDILIQRAKYILGFDRPEKIQPVITDSYAKFSSIARLPETLKKADVVICAAAQKGEGAPKLITREMLKLMQPGSVIVDPSIDEGGCAETSLPTTHDNPIFIEEGVIHYCVSNMPGAVPRSSTPALVNETLTYVLEVANKGWEKALAENPVLAQAAKID